MRLTMPLVLWCILALAPPPLLAADEAEAEARFAAGLAHLREARAPLAEQEFRKALKFDKDNPYYHRGLGQALQAQGSFNEAVEEYERALKANPHYVEVRNDLGAALILAGRREDGKAQLLQAYNDPMHPTPAITARNLGRAYFEEGSYAEALNWFRTAVNRVREYADAYIGISDTLVAMGRTDEAILQLEGGLLAVPDDLGLTLALGEAYYRASRFDEARKKLEDVARRDLGGAAGMRAAALLQKFP